MYNLFKKTKKYPPFPVLDAFDKKDHYFIRTATWDFLNAETVYVNDPYGPRVFTMDPWPQLVFLGANGVLTVTEYVHYMADKYSGQIPSGLDKTILHELNGLLDLKIVEFSRVKQRPKREHDMPMSKRSEREN